MAVDVEGIEVPGPKLASYLHRFEKTELGLDHYEGRNYIGLIRHQIITAATHLFLAKEHELLRKKKPELTVCQVRAATAALMLCCWLGEKAGAKLITRTAHQIAWSQHANAKASASHIKRTKRRLRLAGVRLS